MFDSVRIRLTLWYMGLLALLLVTFSAGVYAVLWRNFMERAERRAALGASDATISILDKELSETGLDELAARDTVKALNLSRIHAGDFRRRGRTARGTAIRQPRPYSPARFPRRQGRREPRVYRGRVRRRS